MFPSGLPVRTIPIAGLFGLLIAFALALPALADADKLADVDKLADATPWTKAVQRNLTSDLARMLTGQQARRLIDARAADGKTAVMAAAAGRDADLLDKLLNAGANAAAVNYKGASALIYGAWGGDVDVLRLLIDSGVPLEQAASNGWTAMTMAAAKGNVDAIRTLLNANANVDSLDVYGWTPLMRACNLGRLDAARALVSEGGASLTRFNASGQTALHLAAAAGQRELYAFLQQAGARSDAKDFRGQTPAGIAAQALQ